MSMLAFVLSLLATTSDIIDARETYSPKPDHTLSTSTASSLYPSSLQGCPHVESLLSSICFAIIICMLSYAIKTMHKMDLYSTLNSLAPNFYLANTNESTNDGSSEVIHDFPPSDEPVYILGRKYSSLHELNEIRADVHSIVWVTYRRNFPSIGDSGMTADSGWGCMLRTGQMVLAQALCKLHLGRDWQWKYPDSSSVQKLLDEHEREKATDASGSNRTSEYEKYLKYRQILKLFADLKTAPYSIHQIALMGACEGKNVGEWFGPNTVAQVLKKLSVYDKVNDIHIHIAMDNMIFIDDIKKFCKSKIKLESMRLATKAVEATELNESDNFWRPLVLFIPLRLGLTDINPVYFRALKSSFAFPQTLGILGGRPNHALYFIGCVGDDLVYLDPHTTQTAVNIADNVRELVCPTTSAATEDDIASEPMELGMDDISYHCERASRLAISQLDPSLALCFLCRTEEDFDQWANLTLKKLIQEEQQPLFEIMKERPANWPMFEEDFEFSQNSSGPSTSCSVTVKANSDSQNADATSSTDPDFTALESDEDYEIID